jgi:hypothetical protein
MAIGHDFAVLQIAESTEFLRQSLFTQVLLHDGVSLLLLLLLCQERERERERSMQATYTWTHDK